MMTDPEGNCNNCEKRPATEWWIVEGGLDAIHGGGIPWCKICCLTTAIESLSEKVERIPEMQEELDELLTQEK